MKTLPPCDHDGCLPTRCVETANAFGVCISDVLCVVAEIIKQMSDDSSWQIVAIVEASEVTGNKQGNAFFGHEYVDQSGPGISGDDYQGHIYLPIQGKYLKVWFAS